MKTRLLIVGDAGCNTGFERVVRGVATHLLSTGMYDITVRAIGLHAMEKATRTYPYTVKPWGGTQDDPLGIMQFKRWLSEDQPDLVLIVNDLWEITNYLAHKPKELPAVVYFPVDTPNMKPLFCMGLGAAAQVATYTKFAAIEAAAGVRRMVDTIFSTQPEDSPVHTGALGWMSLPKPPMNLHVRPERLARYQNVEGYSIIPHGMERGIFEPRDKKEARRFIGIPEDAFVVSNINANQFRKRQDLTIRAFKMLVDEVPEAFLVMHSAGGDRGGWDLLDLCAYFEVSSDRVACVHYANDNLTDDELVWLYNTADVQINTGGGEGWGLTAFEGAACGIPQMVPDWAAPRELWADHGILLPGTDVRVEAKRGLNTLHLSVDAEITAAWLQRFAREPELRTTYSERALELANKQLSWDEIGAAFHQILQNALNEPALNSMTKADIYADRIGEVKSEMQGVPSYRSEYSVWR
jgi:D-inositol-3-phosphate glycosyltransferase